MGLNIQKSIQVKSAARVLTNPPERLPIRPDFPLPVYALEITNIMRMIENELKKINVPLKDVKRITLAYPHKHPVLFKNYTDNATFIVKMVKRDLNKYYPHIKWVTADGICETISLNRSGNQTSLHALIKKQIYTVHTPLQKRRLPFLEKPGREFFIIVDICIEQGTTIANFKSYLEHNGGYVLGTVIGDATVRPIVQEGKQDKKLKKLFRDQSKNTAGLSKLASAFSEATEKKLPPNQCLEIFNAALIKNGLHVHSLTNGECNRLAETVKNERQDSMSFFELIKQLNRPVR